MEVEAFFPQMNIGEREIRARRPRRRSFDPRLPKTGKVAAVGAKKMGKVATLSLLRVSLDRERVEEGTVVSI